LLRTQPATTRLSRQKQAAKPGDHLRTEELRRDLGTDGQRSGQAQSHIVRLELIAQDRFDASQKFRHSAASIQQAQRQPLHPVGQPAIVAGDADEFQQLVVLALTAFPQQAILIRQ